jgi:hypothetical protein
MIYIIEDEDPITLLPLKYFKYEKSTIHKKSCPFNHKIIILNPLLRKI